jgi:hypothetical protein
MAMLDLLTRFDDALDWLADDPLLEEHTPPATVPATWTPVEPVV